MTELSSGSIWLIMLGMGGAAFLIRYSFIGLSSRLELPLALRRALRFLPAAIFSALVFPELLYPEGELDISFANHDLLAGLVALAVAWRSKNILLTLLSGMAALWLLRLF